MLLVDTYDTLQGVRNAIAAARDAGVGLAGVRLDSGDLLTLSRAARELLDEAGMEDDQIAASGDLHEGRIARRWLRRAPRSTSGEWARISARAATPRGRRRLQAGRRRRRDGDWHGAWKRSADKATVPGAKQVFRATSVGTITATSSAPMTRIWTASRCWRPAMRGGQTIASESLEQIRERAAAQLASLPEELRRPEGGPAYPVRYSDRLRAAHGLPSAEP